MQRLHFVDSLRGLAAVYVVLFHVALIPRPHLDLPGAIQAPILFGGSGVFLFFLISGFSLCLTAPRHAATGVPVFSYLASRFFRIAPLFYAFLAAYLAHEVLVLGEALWPRLVVVNALFLFNFMPGYQEGIVAASWTIGVEMLYYLLFAVTGRLAVPWKLALAAVALAAHAAMQADPSYARVLYFSVVGFLPLFLMGELTFHVHERIRGWNPVPAGPLLLAGGVAALAVAIYAIDPKAIILARLVTGVGYAMVLLGLSFVPVRLVVNRVTRLLGQISYSLYLCHPPVIFTILPAYRPIYAALGGSPWAFLACAALTLAIAIPVAWVLFRVVEEPGIRLGRAVVQARIRRLRAAPVA